ncbi:hypothetical protein KR054_005574 [Drosophila jambulina]|nr:hypothetical protein KR054_005574 [Drosophila jambulina]
MAMESKTYGWLDMNEGDCRHVSVGAFFADFIARRLATPSELGLVAYLVLLVISWYALAFIFRILLSLAKLVILVLASLFLCHILSRFDAAGIMDLFIQISSLTMNSRSRPESLIFIPLL